MGSLFKSKRSVKTIFFDIGGVVVSAPMKNYLPLGSEIFSCEKQALEHVTARVLPYLETAQMDTNQFWEKVGQELAESGAGKAVPAWRFKGFWEGILTDSLEIDRELLDLVRRLKAHVRVAVLSNVIKEHAMVLQREKVYDHFNPVLLSCNTGLRKPDPQAYAKAAEIAKTKPSRCLLVDDSEVNLLAAEKSGFRTFHYTNIDDLKRKLYTLGFLDNA
jgi:putative hydrolase of the HAD superfamily